MRFRSSRLTIGQQIAAMGCYFPDFVYCREKNIPTWHGTLQPSGKSPAYHVRVVYSPPKLPKVFVVSPPLESNACHRYSDGSLCLYYPLDGSWTSDIFIAKTIVPWAALWLAFYELWLSTGTWYGPEAPHAGPKEQH